ncbi:chromate efflux transporter [Paraburkholderia kururiensis]|uniref:Chromate efflux transporter n=1 Tax=Paraburkholderia kururiensis TaxID=984307 RepID=A0ABZ0WGP5_9BURK|nr:chromate efflux transporter [Paraburkholderia kururiensis]WQD76524.1 chromate efflux transporter [Paraburkholderia kururiensis]
MPSVSRPAAPTRPSVFEIFAIFLRLGLTCFGGPIAHLGFFREEFVRRRAWLTDAAFADIVALCQFMPGPSSSQVGIALGLRQGGIAGAIAAWTGFTLPSAALLCAFGLLVGRHGATAQAGWLHGLSLVAVAVVAQALWGMLRTLAPDRPRVAIAVVSTAIMLAFATPLAQLAVLVLGALAGWLLRGRLPAMGGHSEAIGAGGRVHAVLMIGLFVLLLLGLPALATVSGNYPLHLFASFFRVGSLVFGGGHVVLPLLEQVVVPPHWVTPEAFIAGYGAAQAVPGPLFTFAAFLGAVSNQQPAGVVGATIAVVAIFLPSFLLVIGVMPLWERLRALAACRYALMGVNAAVVGLLAAAFYSPLCVNALRGPADIAFALVALALLMAARLPPWLVVAISALAGYLFF